MALVFIIFNICKSHAQTLHTHIQAYKNAEILKIESKANEKNKPSKWLNLLPSISYNASDNSVNVGLSLSTFSRYYQQREENKLRANNNKINALNALHSRVLALENKATQYYADSVALAQLHEIYQVSSELFSIYERQYKSNEIDLITFLKYKKQHLTERKQLEEKQNRLTAIRKQIISEINAPHHAE